MSNSPVLSNVSTSRQTVLKGILAGAATGAPVVTVAGQSFVSPPTREEMERYYSFLWCELWALSKEMGVETCDVSVLDDSGGREAYRKACKGQSPSTRAKAILAIGGVWQPGCQLPIHCNPAVDIERSFTTAQKIPTREHLKP